MTDDLADILVNPVTVHSVAYTTNLSADDLRVQSPGTAYMASVQQASASLAASLAADGAVQAGQAIFTVYFGEEPLDTSASPAARLGTHNLIVWTEPGLPARTLVVLGPVRNEGGAFSAGGAYSVDCVEVA